MKINGIHAIPQIIINEILSLNFTQFKILTELNLLEKIIYNKICPHIRYFEERLVYPKINFITKNNKNIDSSQVKDCKTKTLNFVEIKNENCIYCLSNKKMKKFIKFYCDFRNSYEEENHNILNYCEENEIPIDIFDIENLNSFNISISDDNLNPHFNFLENSKIFYKNITSAYISNFEKILLVDDQVIKIDSFFEILNNENTLNKFKNMNCFICNRQIIGNNFKIDFNSIKDKIIKCEICFNNNKFKICSERINKVEKSFDISFTQENIKNFKNKINNKNKKSTCNFIEKLNLRNYFIQHPTETYFEKEEEKSKKDSFDLNKFVHNEIDINRNICFQSSNS